MKHFYNEELQEYVSDIGIDIYGIADLSLYDLEEEPPVDKEFLKKFSYAICIGKRLDNKIIDEIIDKPTSSYADHYREVNQILDILAMKIKTWIEEKAFYAYNIPASQILDEKNLKGELSHKAVARLAGIGWQGKSLLIINPHFGPRFRMATILTNMPFIPNEPVKNRCGSCDRCEKACPAGAIKGMSTKDRYKDRESAIFLSKCYEKLCEFKMMEGIGATVCGVCVKVCPWGRKGDKR